MGADEDRSLATTDAGPWTHLRLRIVPDGGISRLRAWGRPDRAPPSESDPMVAGLNAQADPDARASLARCCGTRRWVEGMMAARPFLSRTQLFGEAERVWWRLGDGDWREAFDHHPRIGADLDRLREKFGTTAQWATGEQAGVAGSAPATLLALQAGNIAYEARFGHLFIVCATGSTAATMLDRLRLRLDNAPENELRIAAGEQAKITRLRLEKLDFST
jgi:2-oxo-4-hydroxy-4-carboxy-5-ureidoimidazoline decarboxylase